MADQDIEKQWFKADYDSVAKRTHKDNPPSTLTDKEKGVYEAKILAVKAELERYVEALKRLEKERDDYRTTLGKFQMESIPYKRITELVLDLFKAAKREPPNLPDPSLPLPTARNNWLLAISNAFWEFLPHHDDETEA